MKPIAIASLFTLGFVLACTVGPKTTPHNSMKSEGAPDYNSENMKHGWSETKDIPDTHSYEANVDSIERGKLIYQHHCQQCHGEKGKGDGPLAETLDLKPADLTNLPKKLPKHYLMIRINKGKGSMPQWDHLLTGKQTWDLTQFVLSLNRK